MFFTKDRFKYDRLEVPRLLIVLKIGLKVVPGLKIVLKIGLQEVGSKWCSK